MEALTAMDLTEAKSFPTTEVDASGTKPFYDALEFNDVYLAPRFSSATHGEPAQETRPQDAVTSTDQQVAVRLSWESMLH